VEAAVVTTARHQFITVLLALIVPQQGRKKRRGRQKGRAIYSTSQVNSMIDATIHPLAAQHWIFVLADGLLHAANESGGDPIETLLKFMKFNMPELLRRLVKQLRESSQE
jgi:hypothetical protein